MLRKLVIGACVVVFSVVGAVWYVSQPLSYKKLYKVVSAERLHDSIWSYVVVNDGALLATVDTVYQLYIMPRIDQPDVRDTLEGMTPVLRSEQDATVRWDGSKIIIRSEGEVFGFMNRAALPYGERVVLLSDSK
ncbi:hypothetical protein LOC54_05520 [Acetobacter sp. AN02]|uniref:hypothetical protein n=1 Tax=Acetobacter sp. AN02 TaxID=2894186 RepID=UPI002434651D|nr:hypothetical protein [Acetobacter sp. AN02]MDG6094575.1 hypothetical protein [Acetobacter sp. AN02]